MLQSLLLKGVGPAPEMRLDLAERLNLITGDNGLGKSFLLDVAWWALTRTWARQLVIPRQASGASIEFAYTKATAGSYRYTSRFEPPRETWSVKNSRPAIPGLVLYAQVDGGFSVWDPVRNYWKENAPDRPSSYRFAPHEVWTGNDHCEGLIRDWASWQREKGDAFESLTQVLGVLSPSKKETLAPGELRKITLDDPLRYPTLRMSYGEDVAVIHASAGMRRVIALAYLLIWAWQEHVAASRLLGKPLAKEVIFLVDEIEAHLHPQWQRRIVPAMLEVMGTLTGDHSSRVQLITATHSPLVLASAEPSFDPQWDAWFDLDLEPSTGKPGRPHVVLRKRPFQRQGEADNWLTSDAFDLRLPRSIESEEAIEMARKLIRSDSASKREIERTETLLRGSLGDTDRFWPLWTEFLERLKKSKPAVSKGKR